jgi:HSP20 family protein
MAGSREGEELRRLVHQFLAQSGNQQYVADLTPNGWQPHVDVYESESAFVVVVELAGVPVEKVEISVSDRKLRISGVRLPQFRGRANQFYRLEVAYGPFERVVELPGAIEVQGAEAQARDGLVEIVLPYAIPVRAVVQRPAPEQAESPRK